MKTARKPARATRPSSDESPERPEGPERPEKIDRRGELVRAAYHLIAAKGLEGLRTRDVAAEVGINISTLHYHFDTKEALIAGVVEHVTHLFKTVHAPLPADATALDELRHLFANHAYRRRIDSHADVVLQEIMLRSRRDPQIRRAFESMLSAWRAAVEEIVARCIRQRLLRADLDIATVAAVITSFQIGANMQLQIAPATFSLDDAGRSFVSWLETSRATPPAKKRR